MPNQHAVSAQQIQQVKDMLATGTPKAQIATKVGVHRDTVRKIAQEAGAAAEPEQTRKPSETVEMVGDKMTITKVSRISDLEGLIAHFKVDREIWEVERWKANKWDMAMKPPATTEYMTTEDGRTIPAWVRFEEEPVITELYQVTATFIKKKAVANARAEIELLRKEALKYSPKFTGFKPRKPAGSGVAVEHAIVDHHFGGLIWGEETGGDDWDSKIALEAWKDAGATLMQRTDSFKPELGLLIFGNDQQNADNRQGATERLTPQQMDGRYQKIFRQSVNASRWMVEQAVARYGRVHIVISPGNHDPLASWHLGLSLEFIFHNLKCVTIDNGAQHRKWWEWGKVMLMFEHGDKGKLDNYGKAMASAKPEMWGRTKVHEAHTGHVHKKQMIEDMGFIVRSLPSLRPSCSWGSENHHMGSIRAAESFVWSKDEGLIGQANFSILQKSEG